MEETNVVYADWEDDNIVASDFLIDAIEDGADEIFISNVPNNKGIRTVLDEIVKSLRREMYAVKIYLDDDMAHLIVY